jgi:uncharacterized membrane protein YphA (DoxX/SURF4 family)
MKSPLFLWIVKILAALILVQTLYFKFTGAPESVFIFQTLGLEPYGRIGLGVVELITAILLLIPRTSLIGAILGVGIMMGAVFSHIFVLGIEVQHDGGGLFTLALVTLLCCCIIVWTKKDELIHFIKLKL